MDDFEHPTVRKLRFAPCHGRHTIARQTAGYAAEYARAASEATDLDMVARQAGLAGRMMAAAMRSYDAAEAVPAMFRTRDRHREGAR